MTTLEINDEAQEVLTRWKREVDKLRMLKGEEVYIKSLRSLTDALQSIISLGGTVYGTNSAVPIDSSLIARNDMITYGVICRQDHFEGNMEFTVHS